MRGRLIACGLLAGLWTCSSILPQDRLAIDQAGYRPDDPKLAFLQAPAGGSFEVRSVSGDSLVYTGEVQRTGRRDPNTGDVVFALDFSPLARPGLYRIVAPGGGAGGPEFRIAADAYGPVCSKALESFYYQRCGAAIDNGTGWKHPACHLETAPFFQDSTQSRDVRGGWHDAGDYNRFTVTTALSAAFLLNAFDQRPGRFTDGELNIPESRNGVPDILDEARWALEWILKMQGPDGGVYHKVSIREWTGEHLPQSETDRQFVFPVSSSATGSAAAVAALGSRLFREADPPFALRLMRCAVRAMDYLDANPGLIPPGGFQNPPGVSGGEYRDYDDNDERLWAAAELFRLTGSEKYNGAFVSRYRRKEVPLTAPGWQNVGNFALYAYIDNPAADRALRSEIVSRLIEYGKLLAGRVEASGYRCVLTADEFYWGSNSVALGYAYDLVQVHRVTGEQKYLLAALDQMHYILGRNAFDQSFATGVGDRAVTRPYHQFSMLFGGDAPVPGMVVGGPNGGGRLDGRILSGYPGRCYEDNQKNYFVNEPAINYTAPLVFLAGYCSSGASLRAGNGAGYE